MKTPTSPSAFLKLRVLLGFALCAIGVLLAFSLLPAATTWAQVPKASSATGKLTAAEAKKMAEGLKPMLNDSPEGLVEVRHANGSVSTDLQGRFQNVTVAVKDAKGTVTQGCINNTEAAAGFFGIDRQLLGLAPKTEPAKPADR